MATLSTTVQNYRTDGGGWYANGTGASSGKWGATNSGGYGPRCFVTRYAFSIPAGKTYKLTAFTWSTGTNYFKYYDGGWSSNLTPRFVIAKDSYASTIQVGDYDGGGIKSLKNFASGSSKTAAWTSSSSTRDAAPNQTGKSISINNAGSQAAIYYLYIYGPDTDYGYSDCKGTLTITYTDETYTACGAPTSVIASGIVALPGSFTVSWSGATGGTNNPISKYTVYWRVTSGGSAPTTSTYTGSFTTSNASVSSHTITLSSATRGYKVVCGVVAVATAGATYNSPIKTGGLVTINSLPNPPALDKASQTITSGAGSVVVTPTAGTDNDTSQTRTVYYATSTEGNKTKYVSGTIRVDPQQAGSLTTYFWTYDGLEYSSATSITITRNNASSLSVGYGKDSYTYGSTATSYEIPKSLTIAAQKSNAGNNSSVKISIKYNASAGIPSTDYTVKASQAVTASGTTVAINPQTEMSPYYNNGANLNYQIIVTYNDGYESTKTVTLPSSGYFIIPAAPSITAVINRHDSTDIPGTTPQRLCRQGRIYFYNDTAMSIASLVANDGSNFNATINGSGTSGNTKYIDFTFDRLPISGSSLALTVTLSNSSTLTKSFSPQGQYYAIKMPVFSSPATTNSTLYPFSNVGDDPTIATDSIIWPFGVNADIDDAASEYQFDQNDLTFTFCSENSDATVKAVSGAFSKDADTLCFTYAAASCTNYADGVIAFDRAGDNTDNSVYGITSYSGTPLVRGRLQLTNLYGEVFTQYFNHTIDFNHQTSKPTADYGVYYGNYEQTYYQQGLELKATNISFKYYTEGTYSYILEVAKTKTPIESDWTEVIRGSIGDLSNTNKNGTTYTSSSPLSIISSIGEVADTYPRSFRIKVYTGNSTPEVEEIPNSFDVIKQTAPTISYDAFNVDRQESGTPVTYTYKYTLENPQLSNIYSVSESQSLTTSANIEYVCDERSTSGSVHSLLTQDGADYVTAYNSESLWERAVRYIQVSTSVTNVPAIVGGVSYTSTQTYFLGGYTVIFISPLVAYRVQQLGINTKKVLPGTTLDIHVGAGNCIRLQGSSKTMVIDMNLGLISFYDNLTAADASSTTDLIHQIDLANGTFN